MPLSQPSLPQAVDRPDPGSREHPAPLTDAYRPIRRVAPPLSPVAGVLVAAGERRAVLADVADATGRVFLHHDLLSMGERPQHLLAPRDVARRDDGHDIELPWCREPSARLLDARASERRPLTGGEIVTLVVSLLRGTAEAWRGVAPEAEGPRGRWWMDDDGCPLFALCEDGGTVAGEAAELLGQAAAHTRDRVLLRLIEDARGALELPRRLGRTLPALEDALFEACAPRPIERVTGRATAAGVPGTAAPTREVAPRARSGALAGAIERFGDTGVAAAVADALDRTRAGMRRTLAGRRRLPLLVGAGVAGLVIAGGLLWPSDPPPADARSRGDVAASASAKPVPSSSSGEAPGPSPAATAGRPADEDAESAGARLLAAAAECAAHGDPLCAAVREDGAEPLDDETLDAIAAADEVTLLDDYGDVAVLRARPGEDGPAAVLEIVRLDGVWLLRAAHPLSAG